MEFTLVFFVLVFGFLANISMTKADYKEDQTAFFKKFGKDLKTNANQQVVVGDETFKSNAAVSRAYTELLEMNCQGERKKIAEVISKQKDIGLINWATLYTTKPTGTLIHNIEFDHIPPGSAHPYDLTEQENIIDKFEDQAPTMAISNFDHRSHLWKQCSTNLNSATPIMKLYKMLVEDGNHFCALFFNLFCIKDIEDHISLIDHISDDPAFERYKDGIKSLINLHYDYGAAVNGVLHYGPEKLSSAYCEMEVDDPLKTTTTTTTPRPVRKKKKGDNCKNKSTEKGSDGKTYTYCKNVKGSYKDCDGKERNLNIKEYEMLKNWLDGTKTDDDMLKECGLDKARWQAMFLKIDWTYDPKKDTNKAGDDSKCVDYKNEWKKP